MRGGASKVGDRPEADNENARTLFLRCADGDAQAWEEFRTRYGPLLAYVIRDRLARAGALRTEDVEEAVSQTYALLLEDGGARLRKYDPTYRPATWLGLIAAGAALESVRARDRRGPPDIATRGAPPEDPAGVAERRERRERLHEALSRMERRDRLLVRLVYEEGLSPTDAARVIGVRPGSAWSLLSRLRTRLRGMLAEE